MVWVKFHDKLCKGAKRGLPRATRFVFMELCLETRPGRGVLDLPVGMKDLDALHDMLGGNRKELADALSHLTKVPPATDDDPEPRAMVELTGEPGARRLTIPSWNDWNSGQEVPGASTERSRRHRRKQSESATNADATPSAPIVRNDCNGDATGMQRSLHDDATATQRNIEERREEEIREETLTQSARAGVREDDVHLALPPSEALLASPETLLAAVAQHPMLATLHGDTTWALRASSGFMTAAVRAADVDAAIDAFVQGEAANAPRDEDLLADWVRREIGRYLKHAKRHGDAARRRAAAMERPSSPTSSDAQATLAVFAEVWAAQKRRPFVASDGDEEHAARLAERARTVGADLGMRPSEIVRWWAKRHVSNADRFVVDSEHALRTLASQLTAYGLPPRPKAKTSPASNAVAANAPHEPYVPPPAEALAAITGLGVPRFDRAPSRRARPGAT